MKNKYKQKKTKRNKIMLIVEKYQMWNNKNKKMKWLFNKNSKKYKSEW